MSNPIVNHITGTSAPPSKSSPPAPLPSNPGTSGAGSSHLKGSSGTLGTSTLPSALHEELPTVQTATSTYLMSVLNTDKQVTKLYAPILEMMESVIKKWFNYIKALCVYFNWAAICVSRDICDMLFLRFNLICTRIIGEIKTKLLEF